MTDSPTGSTGYPQWGLSWVYDRYGNRPTQSIISGCSTITCPTTSLSISPTTNRITSTGFSYNEGGNPTRGNLTNDAANTYTYDAESRIKQVNGGATASYDYDGAGLRVKKTTGGATTVYIFSGSKVIAEYLGGSLSKEYIYAGLQLVATLNSSGTPTYHHPDHLSVRLSTNDSGTQVRSYGHYPFGETWYETGTADKWKFTSYERDSESGLDYAMFRFDSPRLGRFQTPDPLGGTIRNPQSLNRYAYVLNNPVNLIDPLGLVAENCQCGRSYVCRTVTRPDGEIVTTCDWECNTCSGFDASQGETFEDWIQRKWAQLFELLCAALPEGRVSGVGLIFGGLNAFGGTVEVVTNYSSGQTSLFFSGAEQLGWSGAYSVSASNGFIYGDLKPSNSGYAGGFTGGSFSVPTTVPGLSAGPYSAKSSDGKVSAYGANLSHSLLGRYGGSANFSSYSPPIQLFSGMSFSDLDRILSQAKQECQ